jgi:hypothetical protein
MGLMLSVAGGIVIGALGVLVLAEWAQRQLRRGRSITGALARLVFQALGLLVILVGGLYLRSAISNARQERANRDAWTRYSDSVRTAEAWRAELTARFNHESWCDIWAGAPVSDNACAGWVVDTLPPAILGPDVRRYARERWSDSLAADSEITLLDAKVSSTVLEPADILLAWNRWARSHPSADAFGRFRAAALVGKACGLGQPEHADVEVELRSMKGHTEWCYRGWRTDSTIFGGSRIRGRRPAPKIPDTDSIAEAVSPRVAVYDGQAVNTSLPTAVTGRIRLTVHDLQNMTSGYLRVFLPLRGSGPCTINLGGDSIRIISIAADGDTIIWSGLRMGDMIKGRYSIAGGLYRHQYGNWSLTRASGSLPSGR